MQASRLVLHLCEELCRLIPTNLEAGLEMEQEPELEHSPLCQTIERDGIEIEVLIYRLTGDDLWHLEVVDEDNGLKSKVCKVV